MRNAPETSGDLERATNKVFCPVESCEYWVSFGGYFRPLIAALYKHFKTHTELPFSLRRIPGGLLDEKLGEALIQFPGLLKEREQLIADCNLLLTPCSCDPIHSGEQHCNGGCYLKQQLAQSQADAAYHKQSAELANEAWRKKDDEAKDFADQIEELMAEVARLEKLLAMQGVKDFQEGRGRPWSEAEKSLESLNQEASREQD